MQPDYIAEMQDFRTAQLLHSVLFVFRAVLGQQASYFGATLVVASLSSLVSPGLTIRHLWEGEILYR